MVSEIFIVIPKIFASAGRFRLSLTHYGKFNKKDKNVRYYRRININEHGLPRILTMSITMIHCTVQY